MKKDVNDYTKKGRTQYRNMKYRNKERPGEKERHKERNKNERLQPRNERNEETIKVTKA